MQNDKKRRGIANEALTPDEEKELESRVDQMMQLERERADKSVPAEATDMPKQPEATADTTPVDVPSAPPLATAESVEASPAEPTDAAPEATDETIPTEAAEPKPEAAPIVTEAQADDTSRPVEESDAEREAELKRQDEEIAAAFAAPKPAKPHRLRHFFAAWAHSKKARWATVIVVVLLVAAAAAWPTSRAWALNLVGVRASADVTVLDGITKLPLRDVDVSIGGSQGRTNSQGEVSLGLVKLGAQQLRVRKRAFAVSYTTEHIGLGVNHLGTVNLRPAGDRYQLRAIDYVSGKPVAAAMAVAGDAEAIADKQGVITLTISGVNPGDNVSFKAYVSADGYRTQPVNLTNAQSGVTTVQLVTTRPDVYFSNQSGKYDLYKSDIDGQNKKLLVAGTGSETSTLSLLVHPSGAEAAFVDTRDGTHDSDGYLEQSLSLVNVSTGALTTIDHSDRIQLVDWVGDRIVYIKTKAGASAANPSRYQMLSYDYRTNQRLTLDHANAFNDVVSTDGSIYYATSNQYDGGVSQFVSIHADATNRQVLLNTEVWNILRKDYDDFYLSSGNANYTYKLGDAKPTATNETDNNPSRLYVDSPDGKHSLWVDQRDGKGVLLSYDLATQKDTVIAELPGITYPVRWLSNDTIIYRVKTYNETADYVIGLSSNTAKKITDGSDVSGKSLG